MYDEEQDAVEAEVAQQERMLEDTDLDSPAPVMEVRQFGVVTVIGPADEMSLLDEEDAPVDPLDIPDHYDLPMHGSIIACPKCGGEKVRTDYHQAGVLSKPCGARFGWPNIQNLGEHLCRTCTRCQYGWPEQVFSGA